METGKKKTGYATGPFAFCSFRAAVFAAFFWRLVGTSPRNWAESFFSVFNVLVETRTRTPPIRTG